MNAEKIAKLVKIEYENVEKPITTLKEAIEKENFHRQRFPGTKVGDTEGRALKLHSKTKDTCCSFDIFFILWGI